LIASAQYALLSEVMALDINSRLRDVLRETFRRIGTEFLNPSSLANGMPSHPGAEGDDTPSHPGTEGDEYQSKT
jgi:hypothetical protein